MLHFPSPDMGVFGRRQRHVRGHRVPVSIVTSASGAAARDVAIVIDDFGADEALLPEVGCQCCTVRVKLQGALRRLLAERDHRPFSRAVIVTSQSLAPILRTFATERALGAQFYLDDAPMLAGNSFTLVERTSLSWETFSRFMATLTALRGADVLHAKGLLNFEGCRGPVSVHFMQHLSLSPVELQVWPDDDRTSRLELVTRGIDEGVVSGLFNSVRALA